MKWNSGACIGKQKRKVCRCQKGYRKSYIEVGQAMQWPSEKGQNDNSGLHCNIYVKIYWRLQLFGIMHFLMVKD
jgi:hypothetical protein